MRKILYSPGFGAGWTSWMYDRNVAKFALEYKPIIDFLESGGKFEKQYDNDKLHPILKQFVSECKVKFNDEPYVGGARDLVVKEVSGRVRINEYDGSESVEEEGEFSEWI